MKIRFSFSLKILLPFLFLAGLFLVILILLRHSGNNTLIVLSACGILVSLIASVFHLLWLKKPLYRVRDLILQLTRGKLPVFSASGSSDEIGDLERFLEELVGNLRTITQFAGSMARGDFNARYEKRSEDDEMGETLLSLNKSLVASRKESELRRREEENRTWTAHGLAKFSKLFREAEDDLSELSRELMKELVSYTEADVGALFVSLEGEGEQNELVLTGSFAFDREKYVSRTFEFGEGLVGRAAMEKELIYITDLPPGYMKIRSGLGEDIPSSLLLIPVILDERVLGVMELASLGEIPAYQAGFIQQLADALATTLAKIQANLKNRELFEQTRRQAEKLASQELVFRQNLEQLEKAEQEHLQKEEMLKKEIELLKKNS